MIWSAYNEEGRRSGRDTPLVETVEDALKIQITPDFFEHGLISDAGFKEVLHDLDIPEEEQLDLFDTLDVDGGGTIDIEELIEGIGKLRGEAKRSDIVAVKLVVRDIQASIHAFLQNAK